LFVSQRKTLDKFIVAEPRTAITRVVVVDDIVYDSSGSGVNVTCSVCGLRAGSKTIAPPIISAGIRCHMPKGFQMEPPQGKAPAAKIWR
jgi:hypothetical protein